MSDAVYYLTLERIALIRRMVVAWGGTDPGAPTVHPEAPYGILDRDGDIANVTGDDEGAEEEHRSLQQGLAVFARNGQLKPGRYQYHNGLAKLDHGSVGDVFRDVQTGDAGLRARYAAAAAARRDGLARRLRAAGADHLALRTDRDWIGDVVAFVAGRRDRVAAMSRPGGQS